jgi:hypothetical protein
MSHINFTIVLVLIHYVFPQLVFQVNKFFQTGDLITKKRNRLSSKYTRVSMCLNSWLKFN